MVTWTSKASVSSVFYTLLSNTHILTVNQQPGWSLQNVRYNIWNSICGISATYVLQWRITPVSIVIRLWLRWTAIWFPAQARDFSCLHNIQMSCGSHPARVQLSGALHTAVKWPQLEAGCSSPSSVPSTHLHSIVLHLAQTQMYHLYPCCVTVVGMGSVL